MRIEWELESFLVPQEKIEDYFETLYAQKYGMSFRLYFRMSNRRMAIFRVEDVALPVRSAGALYGR